MQFHHKAVHHIERKPKNYARYGVLETFDGLFVDGHPYTYEEWEAVLGVEQGGHAPQDMMRIRLYGARYAQTALRALELAAPADEPHYKLLDEAEALARFKAVTARDAPHVTYDTAAIKREQARIAAAIAQNVGLAEYRTSRIEAGLPFDDYGTLSMPTAADLAIDQGLTPTQPRIA